jgi:predicted acetyltransferase
MGLHEIKKLLHNNNKKMVSKLKRPPTEWEKILAGYTSDEGLITRIYGELKKLKTPPKSMN